MFWLCCFDDTQSYNNSLKKLIFFDSFDYKNKSFEYNFTSYVKMECAGISTITDKKNKWNALAF